MSAPEAIRAVGGNPLLVKGVRTRLRLRHMLLWGTMTLVVAAFLFLLVYLSFTERRLTGPEVAAKATLVPLLVLQGIILMLLGTGSVASGIALERDAGILDFHRMTPMPVGRKLVGYLFGLPAREYFMFAMTLPFVALAVWLGGLPLLKIVHLYGVFFSAVVLYHLTGFVAGMIAARPRRASWIAQAIIVALYLLLPSLSRLGFTFFGYFTILPAFRAIVADELEISDRRLERMADAYGLTEEQTVPFFDWTVHPTVYTLLLQGFLSASFFVVVYRKWRQESLHAFSKPYAMMFYAAFQFLLVGSLWPFLTGARQLEALGRSLRGLPEVKIFLYVFFLLSTAGAAFLLHLVTPTRASQLMGYRRARKAGAAGPPATSDAASSAWCAAGLVLLASAGYAALMRLVLRAAPPDAAAPSAFTVMAPALLLASIVVYIQAAREAWSPRWFGLFLFLLWLVPFFVYLIAAAAWGPQQGWAYLATPSPFTSFFNAVDPLVPPVDAVWRGMPKDWRGAPPLDHPLLALAAVLVAGTLASVLTVLRIRSNRARARDAASPPGEAARPPSDAS